MSLQAKAWALGGILAVIVASGAVAAFLVKEGGSDEWTRTNLVETVLCVFIPGHAPRGFAADVSGAYARMHRTMEDIQPTGDPDRDFARSMIPHHQGAIDVAMIQLKFGRDERLRRLAQAIIVEQTQEIAYLQMVLESARASSPAADLVRSAGTR